MDPVKPLETPEHQEQRARQHVRVNAVLITAGLLAAYFFIFSRGFPWLGTSFFEAVMGRVTHLPWPVNFVLHVILCVIYSFAVAGVVYRLNALVAAFAGLATGAGLYAINYALASMFNLLNPGEEGGILIGHLWFGIFGALIYKAFSVPPPLGVKPEKHISLE